MSKKEIAKKYLSGERFNAVEDAVKEGDSIWPILRDYAKNEGGKMIVSRHSAAVEYIQKELPEFRDAPVLEEVTADAVRGLHVAGNLPLHLAAQARKVTAVLFEGDPPRGQEYGLQKMEEAGAYLKTFEVHSEDDLEKCPFCGAEYIPQGWHCPGCGAC